MTDHLALAPDIIEEMKRDLIDVISRYVEVDRDKIEVNFEQQDKALAMLANIPILSVNRANARPETAPSPSRIAAAAAAPGAPPRPPTVADRRKRRRRRSVANAPERRSQLPRLAVLWRR